MEIEVGEYIKDNKSNIGKVIEIFKGHCTAKYHIEFKGNVKVKRQYLSTKTIIKHSKNIIDLIEVGDIVNGHKVMAVYLEGENKYIKLNDAYSIKNKFTGIRTYSKDIKTILTKEQYNQNCYRLEE